ncbi:MAG: restriction endonuclease subunit S [Treponema sp.]|nr:restriction endonuclease subunit S [Treponema sp.]
MKLPGGWKYIKLSELFEEVSEKNHADAEVLTIVQGVGTVPRKDSGRDIIYDKNSLSNYKYVQKDDFIIHLRSFEGGLEIANQEGIVSPAYIILRTKIQAEPGYLYTLFHSNRFINQTMAPAVEGVRDGRTVKYEVLKNQSIPFPPLAEQQKIAEILCRQDKIISLKQKLLEQKQQQKKWLMQKLLEVPHTNADCEEVFSLGGVVIDKSGWKREKIETVAEISSGSTPRRDETENFNGNILWLTSGELKQKYIFDTKEHISKQGAEKSNLTVYKPGTVVIAIYGLEAAGIRGTCSIINTECTISQACMAFTNFKKVTNEYFYYWYLQNGQAIGSRYAQGTKQQNLSTDLMGNLSIEIPSFPEQKIIAQVLSTADKEIALLKSSIEKEKQKKKSLAQLLLTGTVRVKI